MTKADALATGLEMGVLEVSTVVISQNFKWKYAKELSLISSLLEAGALVDYLTFF